MEGELCELLSEVCLSLSDESVKDAIYDSYAMRKFMGINFFEQDVPDAAALLHFRHLLEEHGIGKLVFDAINRCLEWAGRMMRQHCGGRADQCAQFCQERREEADPEMLQTKRGISGISA